MMATRKPNRIPRMNNLQANLDVKGDAKGTKPTRAASSVPEILVVMVMHVCKKSIFFDTNLKIALYLGALFLLSLIADVIAFPRTYFSRSDNLFNQVFVKIGWFWTLALTVPYVCMTAYTTCCGRRNKVLRGHVTRLFIATALWFLWTTFFNYVESNYGRCNAKMFDNKQACLKNGHFWNGFDISGHCFILIYSSLVLIEEARAIIGWESIKDYIRDEQHDRAVEDNSLRTNPLKNLTEAELRVLHDSYEKYTPFVRGIFIAITLLQVLWDVMLVCTILYYHIMVEKFVSGVIAILTWFVTYRVWYTLPGLYPNLPGQGIFKYNRDKSSVTVTPVARKRATQPNGKHFMGMPIYNKPQDTPDAPVEEAR